MILIIFVVNDCLIIGTRRFGYRSELNGVFTLAVTKGIFVSFFSSVY